MAISCTFSYLELPLCSGSVSENLWYPAVERAELKLVFLKAKCFSKGGRATLIKSDFANLSVISCRCLNVQYQWWTRLKDWNETFYGRGERRNFFLALCCFLLRSSPRLFWTYQYVSFLLINHFNSKLSWKKNYAHYLDLQCLRSLNANDNIIKDEL